MTVQIQLDLTDLDIQTDDIPGWLVHTEGNLTVALDITLNENLVQEGIAREMVNRIQNLRKENGFEVTDRLSIAVKKSTDEAFNTAINNLAPYIFEETLTGNTGTILVETMDEGDTSVHLISIENTETLVELKEMS